MSLGKGVWRPYRNLPGYGRHTRFEVYFERAERNDCPLGVPSPFASS
jgi:hypothetical protein